MNQQDRPRSVLLMVLWVAIACLGRVVPHPANVTPLTSLSIIAGLRFSRRAAVLMVLASMLVSDVLVAMVYGYAPFGLWMWFTYSGFILIALLSPYLCREFKFKSLLLTVFLSALGYWLWTNFGTWLTGTMYPKTFAGLITCYVAGLPFLRDALLGDVVWMSIIIGLLKISVPNLFFDKRVEKIHE
ncbi:MAG: hypothetical protein CMF39_03810 [Legionellaceae bacterium]|nr:hypothetical protein [Legionellaceae bacterium]